MLNVGLSGCNGTMGRIINDLLEEQNDVQVVFGIDIDSQRYKNNYPVYTNASKVDMDCDVVIDFSKPENIDHLLDYCLSHEVAVVIATTGLSEEQEERIKETSKKIPVFRSNNTSLGVNVLIDLVKTATRLLNDNFDIEVIEKHHNKKVDAPSGTAFMIASSINEELNESMDYNYGRQGNQTKRNEKEIGIHSVRGGTIPGEHTVIFAGPDEMIEIKHTALSKKIFAEQAIKAAEFISNKEAKLYNMEDLMHVN